MCGNQFEFTKFNSKRLFRGVDGVNADFDFLRELNGDGIGLHPVHAIIAEGGGNPIALPRKPQINRLPGGKRPGGRRVRHHVFVFLPVLEQWQITETFASRRDPDIAFESQKIFIVVPQQQTGAVKRIGFGKRSGFARLEGCGNFDLNCEITGHFLQNTRCVPLFVDAVITAQVVRGSRNGNGELFICEGDGAIAIRINDLAPIGKVTNGIASGVRGQTDEQKWKQKPLALSRRFHAQKLQKPDAGSRVRKQRLCVVPVTNLICDWAKVFCADVFK